MNGRAAHRCGWTACATSICALRGRAPGLRASTGSIRTCVTGGRAWRRRSVRRLRAKRWHRSMAAILLEAASPDVLGRWRTAAGGDDRDAARDGAGIVRRHALGGARRSRSRRNCWPISRSRRRTARGWAPPTRPNASRLLLRTLDGRKSRCGRRRVGIRGSSILRPDRGAVGSTADLMIARRPQRRHLARASPAPDPWLAPAHPAPNSACRRAGAAISA